MHASIKEDHPRTCGENFQYGVKLDGDAGSPPHLRGKLQRFIFWNFKFRITPAPAGKTVTNEKNHEKEWDHPRTCGENVKDVKFVVLGGGSPPHLRGKPAGLPLYAEQHRITPAPAGKTFFCNRPRGLYRDHPRTCGENFTISPKYSAPPGSPPHLRGKLH